ncbi:MAG: sigma-70 family RNA polymerase sigma factor [Phycisphaerae bacterium]|nr:sigma-70 family RNA polymerase sigma factor [Phycisphaerae bacterium]
MSTSTVSSGLAWYLERIKDTPLLTAQQERQLSRRIREHGDPMAREQMIQANLRLVVKIAKAYVNNAMSISDLVAEGNLGLMRAVEEFDPEAGVRFSTYAAWWIKQAIKRAIVNSGRTIHIPDYLSKLILRWRRANAQLEAEFGRPPTSNEIADFLHVSQKKADVVTRGLLAIHTTPNQTISDDGHTVAEMIPDTHSDAPDQHLMDESTRPMIEAVMQRLDHRSREILALRYGLDGHDGPKRTYKDIGKILGLTRERVRQLEQRAVTDLKTALDKFL